MTILLMFFHDHQNSEYEHKIPKINGKVVHCLAEKGDLTNNGDIEYCYMNGYHDMHKQQYLAGNDEDILQGGSDSTTSLSYLEVKQMIPCRLPLKPIHRICVFSVSFLAVSQELRAPFQELARPRPQIQTI